MQLRRRNILSIYNGPEGLARGKGRKTVSRAGARRLGQLSSPDVLAPVRHLRTPIILTPPTTLDLWVLPLHIITNSTKRLTIRPERSRQPSPCTTGKVLHAHKWCHLGTYVVSWYGKNRVTDGLVAIAFIFHPSASQSSTRA